MSLTFAIPDLHGRYDLLEMALAAIERRSPEGRTVVFLGDYIDRGFQSRQIIEHLMAGPTDDHSRWIVLTGNHEDIMLQAMGDHRKVKWWMGNGGGATLISYGAERGEDVLLTSMQRVPDDHLEWLANLPEFYEDGKRLFVHAGVDPSAKEQKRETLTWKLYVDGYAWGIGDLHVVHGHHHHEDGPLLFQGRTNLDTGAYFTGRLAVGVFDDDKSGGPLETIIIQGKTLAEHQAECIGEP